MTDLRYKLKSDGSINGDVTTNAKAHKCCQDEEGIVVV